MLDARTRTHNGFVGQESVGRVDALRLVGRRISPGGLEVSETSRHFVQDVNLSSAFLLNDVLVNEAKLQSPWEDECGNSHLLSTMTRHCTVYIQTQLPSVLLS